MRARPLFLVVLVVLVLLFCSTTTPATVSAPVLKWSLGGCTSWCQTGWYSSPAVADLDGNGSREVIAGLYTTFVLDGTTGSLLWRMPSGHDRSEATAPDVGRTWPGVVVTDVDADGQLDIVTAHSGGWVSIYDRAGYFKPGWPRQPTTFELRGLAVADLDGDGQKEIVVSSAIGSKTNTWVYEPNGTLRSGWPQIVGSIGYAWGVYNANAAVGNLDGDARGEIVVPSDVFYIAAYRDNGTQIDASLTFGAKKWAEVGVWESPIPEAVGYGLCNGTRVQSYRANFASGPALIADVNGDGQREVVATGNVYDCTSTYVSKYVGPYIFHADRTRFRTGPWDWTNPPVDTGAPLSEDYAVIESAYSDPVVADLDGDGSNEILFASYDGRMHAFWLDRTEHGAWPYSVYSSTEGIFRFASPPVVADLDADGQAEVLFASWVRKGTGLTGRLHIVDSTGHLLQQVNLPAPTGSNTWNGALASPTLANLDADADLELVLVTAHSGVVAYDLPGTSNARVLWATGRGNLERSGACTAPAPGPVDNSVRLAKSGSTDVTLGWAAQPGAASYAVWRSTSKTFSGAIRIGMTSATSFVDAGARVPGAPSYYYKVRARNTCGVEGP